jgi:hypothetical protein
MQNPEMSFYIFYECCVRYHKNMGRAIETDIVVNKRKPVISICQVKRFYNMSSPFIIEQQIYIY